MAQYLRINLRTSTEQASKLCSLPHSFGNGVSFKNIYQFRSEEEDGYRDNQPLLTTQDDETNDENVLFSYKGKKAIDLFEF